MLSKILSASVVGIDAHPVDIEVDIASRRLPHFSMVGLPDGQRRWGQSGHAESKRKEFVICHFCHFERIDPINPSPSTHQTLTPSNTK